MAREIVPGVTALDHVALPTADAERFLRFYKALGFGVEHEAEWRSGAFPIFSITFGDNKINVHPEALVRKARGDPRFLRGPSAEPGCGDLCFVWEGGIEALLDLLRQTGTRPIEGPVPRMGGRGRGSALGISVYARDPDDNLLEFISYDPADVARWRDVRRAGPGARRKD
jgi:catechol 2,3-dioxygenase-like lactoylglutathione lyase family enzyme